MLTTSYAELAEKVGELGAMDVIRKPCGRSEIRDVLNAHKTQASKVGSADASPNVTGRSQRRTPGLTLTG